MLGSFNVQEAEAYAEYNARGLGEEESAVQPPYHMLPMQALDHAVSGSGCLQPFPRLATNMRAAAAQTQIRARCRGGVQIHEAKTMMRLEYNIAYTL
jgi:hypothetical protein